MEKFAKERIDVVIQHLSNQQKELSRISIDLSSIDDCQKDLMTAQGCLQMVIATLKPFTRG